MKILPRGLSLRLLMVAVGGMLGLFVVLGLGLWSLHSSL